MGYLRVAREEKMTEVHAITDVSRSEAEAIAKDIDPQAGGFFRTALARAALMGAQLQRAKLSGSSSYAVGEPVQKDVPAP